MYAALKHLFAFVLCQKKSFRCTKRWEQFSGVEVRLPHPFPVVGERKGGKITVVTVRVGSGRLVKRCIDLAERWEGAGLAGVEMAEVVQGRLLLSPHRVPLLAVAGGPC